MSSRRRQRPAEERLRRLLVVLPWLMERGSVPVGEVAERFAMSESEIVADLELVSMCGLPPFVDELIDVFIDDGMVHVGVPRLFTRSLRLDAVEAFELVAAGRAAMEMPGADPDGPLGRGLAKLESYLGASGTDAGAGAVTVDLERPLVVDTLADAVRRVEQLRLRYWSASTDSSSERDVVPRQVFADRGNWYLLADDGRSGERRTFRVDRIEDVASTGILHDPLDEPLPPPGAWFRDADLERCTLRLAAGARWVAERYPVDEVREIDDGTLEVVLPVASRRWLSRLLIRLGPTARVVRPGWAVDLGVDAVRRVLAIYEASGGAGPDADGRPGAGVGGRGPTRS